MHPDGVEHHRLHGFKSLVNARLALSPPLSPHALAAGALLTLALFASLLSWVDPLALPSSPNPEQASTQREEEIHFVPTPVSTAAPVASPDATKFVRVPREPRIDSSSAPVRIEPAAQPTVAAHPVPEPTSALTPHASRLTLPSSTWNNRDPSLPYLKDAVRSTAPLTAAQRDSANRAFAREAAARIPSADERNDAERAKSSPGTIPGRRAGEQGAIGAGGSISIPFPFLYPGPSSAQRKRDSVALAENQDRLERLKARAQAKRDSAP